MHPTIYRIIVLLLFAASPSIFSGIVGLLLAMITWKPDIVPIAIMVGILQFGLPAMVTGILYLWQIRSKFPQQQCRVAALAGGALTYLYLLAILLIGDLIKGTNHIVNISASLYIPVCFALIGAATGALIAWLITDLEQRFPHFRP